LQSEAHSAASSATGVPLRRQHGLVLRFRGGRIHQHSWIVRNRIFLRDHWTRRPIRSVHQCQAVRNDGICGGYTTFSAFSLQSLSLFQDGAWYRGGSYVAASVVLCLIAVWGGYVLASAINGVFE
jgi:hypothetical protein